MSITPLNTENVKVRLAETPQEIDAAQHLRYRVFYEENHAKPSPEMLAERRDFDRYDEFADHLIAIDESLTDPRARVVGTYRLLRKDNIDKFKTFYTAGEFDIAPILASKETLLEVGRSCVLEPYRTRPVLQALWQGITDYMLDHNIGLMFGCASLHGTNIDDLKVPLSYLHHFHRAPDNMLPRALPGMYVDMNLLPKDQIDEKATFSALPPLIKGYIRLGAMIGDGAIVDEQFNTTDVCIVMPMAQVTERYRKFYSRRVNRPIPTASERAELAREQS